MAKQAGIHGLRGKVNGMSYYYSKNGGELARKINEGIGERVKTSAAYVNTRKNNAEFGAAGASAGLIMRTIPQQYRYILLSNATGLLNKAIREQMDLDSVNKWGERVVFGAGQSKIIEFFNTLSKNNVPELIKNFMSVGIFQDSEAEKVFIKNALLMDDLFVEEMKSAGATHVTILFYGINAELPQFDSTSGKYIFPAAKIQSLVPFATINAELISGEELIAAETDSINFAVENDDNSQVSGVFAVVLPQRKVGSGFNTLQEHCSACWVPATTGTVEP